MTKEIIPRVQGSALIHFWPGGGGGGGGEGGSSPGPTIGVLPLHPAGELQPPDPQFFLFGFPDSFSSLMLLTLPSITIH